MIWPASMQDTTSLDHQCISLLGSFNRDCVLSQPISTGVLCNDSVSFTLRAAARDFTLNAAAKLALHCYASQDPLPSPHPAPTGIICGGASSSKASRKGDERGAWTVN